MGTAERKRRQKDEVREAILSSAWKLVLSEGWQGLSIRKIAEAIEYSVPVIYDHFENKEAILREFTRQGFRMLAEVTKNASDLTLPPSDRIRSLARAYWNFAFSNQEYYHLMYGMGMPSCETVGEMEELQVFTSEVQSTIRELIPPSENAEAESMIGMKSFWSMMHGLVSIHMMAGNSINPGEEVLMQSLNNFISVNSIKQTITSNNKQS